MISPRQVRTVTLRDGAHVTLRQVVPEDKPLLVDMFDRLSERSRYQRFFTSMRELSPVTLAYFTEIDHSQREAIIAIDAQSERALGVARYVRLQEEPATAEIAVAVVDEWHHRGVAPMMLAELSRRARRAGVERFVAVVQATNRDALALADGVGPSTLRRAGPNLELVIDLGSRATRATARRAGAALHIGG
jgi:GNAT superfamily N-acetyltransferase